MNPLDNLTLDNPFWQFSLSQWKNKILQKQLLNLQDTKGYRINVLLVSLWLSKEHRDIRPHLNTLLTSTSQWHDKIVTPIRKARQALPSQLPAQTPSLKQQLQAAELQAEQIEQALLYEASLSIPQSQHTTLDLLDWSIINLSASKLPESDLFLLLQNVLPTYPTEQIKLKLHQFYRTRK